MVFIETKVVFDHNKYQDGRGNAKRKTKDIYKNEYFVFGEISKGRFVVQFEHFDRVLSSIGQCSGSDYARQLKAR